MGPFKHDAVVPFGESDQPKKQQVAAMFDQIAFRYDLLNHLLSAGIDRYWRKQAIAEILDAKPRLVLDVATGTGDVAVLISRYLHAVKIVGIDISEKMLEIGRKKIAKLASGDSIDLLSGDSEAIGFPDCHFDAVTVAFGVRNFERLRQGLAEICRVLKPEGKLVVLEFSKPRGWLTKRVFHIYMNIIASRVGNLVSKNRHAYHYLHHSVDAFPEGRDFLAILEESGYVQSYQRKLTMGICSIYAAKKPGFTK